MYNPNPRNETRMYVKIRFAENGISALAKVLYFRNEMRVDFFHRWKWYFEYRAALLRVAHPRAFIELASGPYDYVLPDDAYRTKVKNQYLSDKRQLTKLKNQLAVIEQNWNELFPIDEHPHWQRVMTKYQQYTARLQQSTDIYNSVFRNE